MDAIQHLNSLLGSRYLVERELGVGGMAAVYLARDVKHDRPVAIKVLSQTVSHSLGHERFLREIHIVARLQHPHILGLIDSGEAGGILYYVMPYVSGESLRTRLAREGELPIAEAVWILREIADALGHAHGHQIIHRDIKPENVLFSARHALVADFGIARAVSEAAAAGPITGTGIVVGSPAYMAPEQASSDPQMDHRADIYAFGVLAYEVLTGVPPFTAPGPVQLVAAHMTRMPDPLTRHRPGIPDALEEIVLRCLAKRPQDRYSRADEIVARLDALLTGPLSQSVGTAEERPVASSKFRLTEGLARRLDRQVFDSRMVGDSMEYLDNHARSDTLVCFIPAVGLDSAEYEDHLRKLPWRCMSVSLYSHEPNRSRRYALSLNDHFTLIRAFIRHVEERTGATRVVLAGFGSGGDIALRFGAARPGGGVRLDGVMTAGANLSGETCVIERMLARMSSRHPERLLADLRLASEGTEGLDGWLTMHAHLVSILTKFRSAVDPVRQLAREMVGPFDAGGDGQFASWFGPCATGVKAMRCIFPDDERHRTVVGGLVVAGKTGPLGPAYAGGSVKVEPGASRFALERPEIFEKHIASLLAEVPARSAAAQQATGN